jgi:hypothetical protein
MVEKGASRHPSISSDHEQREAKEMTRDLQREHVLYVEMDGHRVKPIAHQRSLFPSISNVFPPVMRVIVDGKREPDHPRSNIKHDGVKDVDYRVLS